MVELGSCIESCLPIDFALQAKSYEFVLQREQLRARRHHQGAEVLTVYCLGHQLIVRHQAIGGCMLALGTVFVIVRFAVRAIKQRLSLSEDVPIFVAWACLLAQCTGYILATPAIYRALAVYRGEALSTESSRSDEISLRRSLFTNTLLFWTSLWAVKISLLVQSRRLIDRGERRLKAWGLVFGFCVLSYVGCVVSHLTVCGPLNSWFNPSKLNLPKPGLRAQFAHMMKLNAEVHQTHSGP